MTRRLVGVASLAFALTAGGITARVLASGRLDSSATSDTCGAYQPGLPDAGHFVTKIDNPYFPLPIGRTLVYRGTQDGHRQTDRVTVTPDTRQIEGITATTVRDITRQRGALVEKTKDWYAQDDQGNVWYLGEATKAYEGGKVDTSGSWIAGLNGGKPGLIMEAVPHVPDSYRQECLQGQAEDMAWIVSTGGSANVPFGRVHRVVRSLEYARIEPDVVDQKTYAPGLGIVSERTMAGGHEEWSLVRVRT